jgi:hypothetical protein
MVKKEHGKKSLPKIITEVREKKMLALARNQGLNFSGLNMFEGLFRTYLVQLLYPELVRLRFVPEVTQAMGQTFPGPWMLEYNVLQLVSVENPSIFGSLSFAEEGSAIVKKMSEIDSGLRLGQPRAQFLDYVREQYGVSPLDILFQEFQLIDPNDIRTFPLFGEKLNYYHDPIMAAFHMYQRRLNGYSVHVLDKEQRGETAAYLNDTLNGDNLMNQQKRKVVDRIRGLAFKAAEEAVARGERIKPYESEPFITEKGIGEHGALFELADVFESTTPNHVELSYSPFVICQKK